MPGVENSFFSIYSHIMMIHSFLVQERRPRADSSEISEIFESARVASTSHNRVASEKLCNENTIWSASPSLLSFGWRFLFQKMFGRCHNYNNHL